MQAIYKRILIRPLKTNAANKNLIVVVEKPQSHVACGKKADGTLRLSQTEEKDP